MRRRIPHAPLPALSVLALPLLLAACGDGTDPAATGAVGDPTVDGPAVTAPADPIDPAAPAAPPAADDTTLQ